MSARSNFRHERRPFRTWWERASSQIKKKEWETSFVHKTDRYLHACNCKCFYRAHTIIVNKPVHQKAYYMHSIMFGNLSWLKWRKKNSSPVRIIPVGIIPVFHHSCICCLLTTYNTFNSQPVACYLLLELCTWWDTKKLDNGSLWKRSIGKTSSWETRFSRCL